MRRLSLQPIPLPGADVRLLVRAFRLPAILARPLLGRVLAGARGGKDPSLLIHARARGGDAPSEVQWLNGAVARAGESLAVPTPVNRRLTALVEEVLADPSDGTGSAAGPTGSSPRCANPASDARGRSIYWPAMDTGAVLAAAASIVAAYLIGAIPFGVVVARGHRRPDPRTVGSGRTGGANTLRALGLGPALAAGFLDTAKGAVAVLIPIALGGGSAAAGGLRAGGHLRPQPLRSTSGSAAVAASLRASARRSCSSRGWPWSCCRSTWESSSITRYSSLGSLAAIGERWCGPDGCRRRRTACRPSTSLYAIGAPALDLALPPRQHPAPGRRPGAQDRVPPLRRRGPVISRPPCSRQPRRPGSGSGTSRASRRRTVEIAGVDVGGITGSGLCAVKSFDSRVLPVSATTTLTVSTSPMMSTLPDAPSLLLV